MHKLIALFYFILALAGCDHAGRTIIMRSTTNGTDRIYSRVTVLGPTSTFECIHSRSGQCHYGVFERDCTTNPSCSAPIRQFAMAADTERGMADLPLDFELCVSADATPMTRDCLNPAAANKTSVASASS
ncbi:MAG TPA: hypothetical protein VGC19_06580 [Rhodanobacter sp.]